MHINRRVFLRQSSFTTAIVAASATQLPCQAEDFTRIKAAQIGTKHAHASGKLAALRRLGKLYEVIGVVEPDDKRWNLVRDKDPFKGLLRLTEQELFADRDLKVIAVETDVKDLVPTALRCVRNDKHIHLDKPAGESMPAYRNLRNESDERSVTVQMGYMLRYNPAFQFLFNAVKSNWLGTITEVSGNIGKLASPSLRKELSQYRGGGMFELACHLIDAVVTILGKPDHVSSFSKTVRPDDAFKDNQLAVLEYKNALATIRCNHVDPLGFSRRSFSVTGDKGTIVINPLEPPALQMSLSRTAGKYDRGTHSIKLPESEGRYDDEFKDLAEVVRGSKKLAWNSAHDLAAHETVLRAAGLPVK